MDDNAKIPSLPDDPAILKELIATRTRERDQLQSQKEQLEHHARELELEKQAIELEKLKLEAELLRLKKLYYGPRADRLANVSALNQMLLAFACDLENQPLNPADVPQETPETQLKTIRCVGRSRRNLAAFDQLPVTREVHDLAEGQKPCPCCGKTRERIGEESSWQIEFVPGRFERIEHVRIKYACRGCEQEATNPQITRADKPTQPIEKGMAGPGLLAYVITSKFADYLPLYRLENIFERSGFEINRATQSVWCGDVADLLRPLYALMVKRVLVLCQPSIDG